MLANYTTQDCALAHQFAHMPAMDKLQRVAVVQTPEVQPPEVIMAPESRKQTLEQTPNIIYKKQWEA